MSKIIESIDYFPAGYCTSYTGLLFKKVKNKKMTFPAGVFLIKHRDKGYLLYDTGYHYDIKTKLRYGLYRLGTPVQMTEKDQISSLLKARGIRPEDITYVMLSHLHPDHLGGAGFFPNASFLLTQEVYEVYQKPKLKDLIFKEFLPASFEKQLRVSTFQIIIFLSQRTCAGVSICYLIRNKCTSFRPWFRIICRIILRELSY